MKVIKRDGRIVDFEVDRIINAIEKAMLDTKQGIDTTLSNQIGSEIKRLISDYMSVEDIQDMVEVELMESNRKDVAKAYILYRNERSKHRPNKPSQYKLLTDEFISKYKHKPSPFKELGSFVYYRTYSRYLPEEKRREYWWETVRRTVEYNCTLVPTTTKEEAEKLFDNVYNGKQFLSGRSFWVGGTEVAKKYPISNYNCSFTVIDNFQAFRDLFYLLMVGSGCGVRVIKSDVEKLPSLNNNVTLINKDYIPVNKKDREDMTSLKFSKDTATIVIGDSKEGWVQSLDYYLELHWSKEYKNIKRIIIDYDNVRRKGEKLKTFGGTASGHESIKNMFIKINKIIKNKPKNTPDERIKLKPIDCMDIANIIGENVVVGGVRRTAEIILIDSDDTECISAKKNLYIQKNGVWEENTDISHRKMSNNSIFYKSKPTRERLHWQIETMRYSGEPAFINAESASKRRPNFEGLNPCAEILLDSNGLCNLTTINVFAFVNPDGTLDYAGLLEAQRLSARTGYRMTCVELELPVWNNVQQRDKLLGCSLTGWQDMINATGMTTTQENELLHQLKVAANQEAKKYAHSLGGNTPVLVTTVKPEGTLSLLPTVSSGIHYSHSPYYIRRIRINSHDPLCKVCEELDYPVFIENGQTEENCNTKVIEFPVKSPEGRTKYDVSALEQLDNYLRFMEHYVDHNASITVTVKDTEWEEVEQWLWDNWDDVIAISFLPLSDAFYPLMPYESITEEEYNDRVSKMKPFIPSLISKYEMDESELDIGDEGCESGVCPIR